MKCIEIVKNRSINISFYTIPQKLEWSVFFFVTCSHADEQKSQNNSSSSHDVGGWITRSDRNHSVFTSCRIVGGGCVCVCDRSRWKYKHTLALEIYSKHWHTHAVNFCSAISYKRSFDAPTLALDTKIIKSGDFCFFQNVGIFFIY